MSWNICYTIIADVEVLLSHSTTIKVGYHPLLHVRTSAVIEKISDKIMFIFWKKFIKEGSLLLELL
jgi:GTPase